MRLNNIFSIVKVIFIKMKACANYLKGKRVDYVSQWYGEKSASLKVLVE